MAPAGWLLKQGVNEYMGLESMAMWPGQSGTEGWSAGPEPLPSPLVCGTVRGRHC